MPNKPDFSRLSEGVSKRKKLHKQKRHRANRKRLHQSRTPEEHRDKPLDPRAID